MKKIRKEKEQQPQLNEGRLTVIEGMLMRASLLRFKMRGGHSGWHTNTTVGDNLKDLTQALKPYDEYERKIKGDAMVYLKEEEALRIKHSTVDGVLKTKEVFGVDQYDIRDQLQFEKELTELREKHKIVYDTYLKLFNEHHDNMQKKELDFDVVYLSREAGEKELKDIQDEDFRLLQCIIEPRKKI
jgi:hypothetical protein